MLCPRKQPRSMMHDLFRLIREHTEMLEKWMRDSRGEADVSQLTSLPFFDMDIVEYFDTNPITIPQISPFLDYTLDSLNNSFPVGTFVSAVRGTFGDGCLISRHNATVVLHFYKTETVDQRNNMTEHFASFSRRPRREDGVLDTTLMTEVIWQDNGGHSVVESACLQNINDVRITPQAALGGVG